MKLKKIVIIITILFVFASAASFYFKYRNKNTTEYITAIVKKGEIIQTVSQTGSVKSANEIDLNFQNNGKVNAIYVKVGDKVQKDQLLAELDNADILLKEKQAQADLQVAQANLIKLLKGATNQAIDISQANLNQAETNYNSQQTELEKTGNSVKVTIDQAQKNLNDLESTDANNTTTYEQAIISAQSNLDNTQATYQQSIDNNLSSSLVTIEAKNKMIKIALDNINTILNDSDAKYNLSVQDQSYLVKTSDIYNAAVKLNLNGAGALADAEGSKTPNSIKPALAASISALSKTSEALDSCYTVLEKSITGSTFTSAKLDAYKTNISGQQSAISLAITAVQTSEHNLDDAELNYIAYVSAAEKNLAQAKNNLDNAVVAAKNSLAQAQASGEQEIVQAQSKVDNAFKAWQLAKAQLVEKTSPPRQEDVNLTQAQVNQAQIALDLIKEQMDNNTIKAPIDGTITKKNYEIGEQTSAAKAAFSLLSNNNFEIDADISEADIAKVKLSNPVQITFDAFGEETKFNGSVVFIEPAETVIQDVIYYKVKINFSPIPVSADKAADIKSGLTANVIITTAKKDGVLLIPGRAIIEKSGDGKYLRILINNQVEERPITIGLRGDESLVELINGANEGEMVITSTKTSGQ